MTVIAYLLYNFLFIPIFYLMLHLAALFNKKIRRGVSGRYRSYCRLRQAVGNLAPKPVLVVHCASMGEFEHIKPFLIEFKNKKPDYAIIVLFFSPSGYENVTSFPAVDLFLYSPFDWIFPVWRFLRRVKPALWVIAKHDVWPNQVWTTDFLKIPVFLINASLHRQSSRLWGVARPFHRSIYQRFTKVLTISEQDHQNFRLLVTDQKLAVVGDTKYDQVLYRRDQDAGLRIMPPELVANRWVLVAGSTWPEDHRHLLPATKTLLEKNAGFFLIICPHEPTENHLHHILSHFSSRTAILLSQLENYAGESVIVVDRVGVLANLYGLGKAAYVGGSFRQNIHNVMEPAAYRIPVLFGPVNQNSHDAQLLKANGSGLEVHQEADIQNYIEKFMRNDIYRQEAGLKAYQVVRKNCGATERTVNTILSYLK